MLALDVIVPRSAPRNWQAVIIRRLEDDGHDVAIHHQPDTPRWPGTADALLALERRAFRGTLPALAARCGEIAPRPAARPPRLRLDLTGSAPASQTPTLALRFDGSAFDFATATAVAAGRLPEIEAVLDGKTVAGRARPMIDRRFSTALGLEDVLARAATLAVATVRAFAEGRLEDMGTPSGAEASTGFSAAWLTRALPRLGSEIARRARFRHAHWNVGYRFLDGPGVADIGRLGSGWTVLTAPEGRFYADPFPFEWRGRAFLFVEDYVHAAGKAAISVVPLDAAGRPLPPRPVLEEPWHLSYPQVFARDGAIWMLPEASASGRLTLYRATDFPDRWHPAAVLLEGEISDATLIDHGGRLWLLATVRDSFGSTSDTLAVFHAEALAGPWRPHPLNPVLIDRRMARPGGAFLRDRAGRILLPMQDGTTGYGGGLGLCELLALDGKTVRLSEPRLIDPAGDWPHPRIHTLNRAGRLEVIDGIAAASRWSAR